jgi:hypothetical protein
MTRKPFRISWTAIFALIAIATLIATVAVFQWNWIRQRREFVEVERAIQQKRNAAMMILYTYPSEPKPRAPALLWLLGEEGHAGVYVLGKVLNSQQCSASDMDRLRSAKQLFPEATVYLANEFPQNGPNSFAGRVAPDVPDVP